MIIKTLFNVYCIQQPAENQFDFNDVLNNIFINYLC